MGWFEFALAYVVFFLSHSLPVRPPLRPWLQARLGASGFTLAYSAQSFAVLAWLIAAAGRWSRHPLLAALALWAAAHVVPNGDLAHLILFGTFAAFAFLGGRLIDRRKRHEMGPEWQRLVWLSKARRACPGAGWEAPLRGLWPVLSSTRRSFGCIPFSSASVRFLDGYSLMSSIQVFAATARGRPSGPMASIATCVIAAGSIPSDLARRVWECTAPSDPAPMASASLTRRFSRGVNGPQSALALPKAA